MLMILMPTDQGYLDFSRCPLAVFGLLLINALLDCPDHSVESRNYSWDRAEQLVKPSDLGRPFLSRGA
jgi:hypothetical protein